MDDLDVRIIKELTSPRSFQWNVRESYADLAGTLGVDEETVRRRIKRLTETAFFRGFQLIPNPGLLRMKLTAFDIEVEEARKAEILPLLHLLEGAVFVIDFHGSAARVVLFYDGDLALARKAEFLGRLCHSPTPTSWPGVVPPSDFRPRRTDWRIIQALRRAPRRSLSQVADELGLSARTIKRRVAAMTEANAFFLMPVIQVSQFDGVIANFAFSCLAPEKKRAIDERIRSKFPRVQFEFTSSRERSSFNIVCRNLSGAEGTRAWIQGLDGVDGLRMGILRDFAITEWLDAEIERRLIDVSRAAIPASRQQPWS